MNTTLDITEAIDLKLTDALMVYTQNGKASYVTHHAVTSGQLGPAKPLTDEFLTKLSEELERRVKVEILPEKVLVRTPHTIVWWTPERRRRIYFTTSHGDEPTADLSGHFYQHPALVWMVTGHALVIRALATNDRPTETTPLYLAPYWNTSEDGHVCLGDMKRPDTTTARTIDEWEEGFFASRFTHPNATKLLKWSQPYISWVRSELLHVPFFPTQYLVDAKQTLEQFIQKGGR